jgi:hypothetical protein
MRPAPEFDQDRREALRTLMGLGLAAVPVAALGACAAPGSDLVGPDRVGSDGTTPLRIATIGPGTASRGGLAAGADRVLALTAAAAVSRFSTQGASLEHRGHLTVPARQLPRRILALADAGVSAVLCWLSDDELEQVLPTMLDAELLVVSPTSTSTTLRSRVPDRGLLIRTGPTTRLLAQVLGEESLRSSGSQGEPGSVAWVGPDTSASRSLLRDLATYLEPRGGRIVHELVHPVGQIEGTRDPVEAARAILAARPASLIVTSGPERLDLLTALAAALEAEDAGTRIAVRIGPDLLAALEARVDDGGNAADGGSSPDRGSGERRDADLLPPGTRALLPGPPPDPEIVRMVANEDPGLWREEPGRAVRFASSAATWDSVGLLAAAAALTPQRRGPELAAVLPTALATLTGPSGLTRLEDRDAADATLTEIELATDGSPHSGAISMFVTLTEESSTPSSRVTSTA